MKSIVFFGQVFILSILYSFFRICCMGVFMTKEQKYKEALEAIVSYEPDSIMSYEMYLVAVVAIARKALEDG